MRCVVVETQVMVYDRIVGVIRFDQVLQGSRAFLGGGLDIVNFDGRQVDRLVASTASCKKRR